MFNGVEFAQWQLAAMSCSADEGSKMYFRLRSGVKYEDRDLVKLTLINYLFNQGMIYHVCTAVTWRLSHLRGATE